MEKTASLPEPEPLEWQVSPATLQALASAEKSFQSLVDSQQLEVFTNRAYGKSLLKKLGVSPDAVCPAPACSPHHQFTQMVIQLAYYKQNGEVCATYESAQTRQYAYGRTETCRTASIASKAFVQAMADPGVSMRDKGARLRAAVASHAAYMGKAVKGEGVDRHLLGLRKMLPVGAPVPAIFTDELVQASAYWKLSTSQITSEFYGMCV